MIYFNGTEFVANKLKATYYNEQDDVQRVKYDDDKTYWDNFVNKWSHCRDLEWSDVVLTSEQQERLDLLNEQEDCCDMYGAQASIFVEHGVILPNDVPPFLVDIQGDYEAETLAWAEGEYGQSFATIDELSEFLSE